MNNGAYAVADTSAAPASAVPVHARDYSDAVQRSLKRRYAAERRFRAYGVTAIAVALLALATLFVTIFGTGISAFRQAELTLEVTLAESVVDPAGTRDPENLAAANYRAPVFDAMDALFPDVSSRADRRQLYEMVSQGAEFQLRGMVLENPGLIGQTVRVAVPASDDIDQLAKGHIPTDVPEDERRVSDKQLAWYTSLEERGLVGLAFNTALFTNGDSREPELAGIWGAVVGSFLTLFVTLILSFPIAAASAIYLEEFAPKNRWTALIEVNINNLAAVPSIVFGLLGLAVFLNFFGLPRSAPLVGGMVLTLMTLPTIIITSRAAMKSVPPSIREAALGLGASKVQMVFQHVLPLAMPGMLTGTIIGMAQALGETAPLLMIGMVAFIVDVPGGFTDPATVLPVQVYLWSDSPERAFVERTAAAIVVLLGFLVIMNVGAVLLRKRFERRW